MNKRYIIHFEPINIFPQPNKYYLVDFSKIYDMFLILEEERSPNRAIHSPITAKAKPKSNYGGGSVDMDSWILPKSQMEIHMKEPYNSGVCMTSIDIRQAKNSTKYELLFDLNDVYDFPIDVDDSYKKVWINESDVISVEPYLAICGEQKKIENERPPKEKYFSFKSNINGKYYCYEKVGSLLEIAKKMDNDFLIESIKNITTRGHKDTGLIFFSKEVDKIITNYHNEVNLGQKPETQKPIEVIKIPIQNNFTTNNSLSFVNKNTSPFDSVDKNIIKSVINSHKQLSDTIGQNTDIEERLNNLCSMVAMSDVNILSSHPLGLLVMNNFKTTLRYLLPHLDDVLMGEDEILCYIDNVFGELIDSLATLKVDAKPSDFKYIVNNVELDPRDIDKNLNDYDELDLDNEKNND